MKSVVSTPEVVGDFTVHDRPAGEASGCTGVPETPQLEVIQPNQMSEIESVQDPMPDTSPGKTPLTRGTCIVRLRTRRLNLGVPLYASTMPDTNPTGVPTGRGVPAGSLTGGVGPWIH